MAAQDQTTAERFCQLGVPAERVHVTGSLKFDNVNADRGHVEVRRRAELVGLTGQERVFVVAARKIPKRWPRWLQ